MARASLGLVMALALGAGVPARAATVTVRGSVQLQLGDAFSVERYQYMADGCSQDVTDGTVGAYIDVRGYASVKIKTGAADVAAPVGPFPRMAGRLFDGCDAAEPSYPGYTKVCSAIPACTMTVGSNRYLEVVIITGGAYGGVDYTVELTK